eukprot:g21350.t1
MLPFCWLLPTLAAVSAASEQVLTEAPSCDGVFFATFNIQNYGVSKASKPAVLDALAATIHRYDVVTIQEQRVEQLVRLRKENGENKAVYFQDHTESAICDLQAAVNAQGRSFSLAIFPRIGDEQTLGELRECDWLVGRDSLYAVMYDSSKALFLEGATYPDNSSVYSRPPYAFHLQVGGSSMVIASTHTSPSSASSEPWPWRVSSAMEASGCADYISSDICSSSTVEWHEVAKELSDHYPVELCMHLNGSCTDCVAFTTVAPQQLGADSCARVGFHADNPDDFGLLFLEALAPQSSVYVTDGGCSASGVLREGEGLLQFQASEELPAGSVLSLENFSSVSGTFSLSISGDQILVFSGSKDNPTYMCAINFDGSGWASGAESASTSALPPGLTGFALPETDNAAYVGSTTGTVQELLQWIHLEENWRSDNSEAVPIPRSFTVVTTTTSTASGTTTNTATTTGSHTHTVTQTTTSTGNRLYQSVGYVAVSASTDACRVRWYLPCAIAVLVA